MEVLGTRVALRDQILKVVDQAGLHPCEKGNTAGGALQIHRPSHGQSGAVCLGLQQWVGGCRSAVHGQLSKPMA
jgi:hypothetical protein